MQHFVKIVDNQVAAIVPYLAIASLNPSDRLQQGYYELFDQAKPDTVYDTVLSEPVSEAGKWVRTWQQVETSQSVADAKTARRAANIRKNRDALIEATTWRVERYNREIRIGVTPSEDIATLDAYIQALADIPNQPGFPWEVTFPTPLV